MITRTREVIPVLTGALVSYMREETLLEKFFAQNHVDFNQQILFVLRMSAQIQLRNKIEKVEPIDTISTRAKSQFRYIHMEIIRTVPRIAEIEPMDINII